jgi:hypothetical protein
MDFDDVLSRIRMLLKTWRAPYEQH